MTILSKEKPKIMNFDSKLESYFLEKTITGIDRFVAEGGRTILFDWDGTIRGNNYSQGISNYIRRGFYEAYLYAKSKELKVGVCTLRLTSEIENLEHLNIHFDEYNGIDTMMRYIENNPSKFHEKASKFLTLTEKELIEISNDLAANKKSYEWEVLLQTAGEIQTNNSQHQNIKILFLAHKLSDGEKLFLIDDDETSGGTAEKFGVGILVPKPAGYRYDK